MGNLRLGDDCFMEYTAFAGHRHIATGELAEVALEAKRLVDRGEDVFVTIFNNETGHVVDVDFRGSMDEFSERLRRRAEVGGVRDTETADTAADTDKADKRSGPGRPRLGVVGREVTLLPRHWEWLNAQPGGASVTLRRLVEKARKEGRAAERARRLRDGAYQFMSYVAGDFPGFEEASRALFAQDYERLNDLIREWPEDVRDHLRRLASRVEAAAAEAAQATQGGGTDN